MEKEIPFINQPVEEIGHGTFSDVYKLEHDPRFVIKEYNSPGLDSHNLKDKAANLKAGFEQLQKALGEYVPDTDFILGEKQSREAIFLVQRKILGKQLSLELLKEDEKVKSCLADFINRSARNFAVTYDQKSGYGLAPDIALVNFLWGKKANEPEAEDKLYYIDSTPPFFALKLNGFKSTVNVYKDLGLDLKEAESALEKLRRPKLEA